MNLPRNREYEPSPDSQTATPASMGPFRVMYWAIRRELWENRSIYIAPLAAALISMAAVLISLARLRRRLGSLNPMDQQHTLTTTYEYAAAAVMATVFVVGVFYTLDALYGERRDRSILFWKSLPVSDLTTVLSKLIVPLFVVPLVGSIICLAMQLILLLLSSMVLLGSGMSVAAVWNSSPFFSFSLALLYHMLTVHGLWYAPLYAWLLLVSAWVPRAPIVWAFLPPLVIGMVEKIAFNTTYFGGMLKTRLLGPEFSSAMASSGGMDAMSLVPPLQFFILPGLWIGLAIAAAFLAATVRLRRYRGPI
jgi:ABC-2 type transport system permease protein